MSEIPGPPPTSAYGMTTPSVSYPQMMPQGAPPSYAESLTHPVVAGHPGMPPQYASPYMSPAAAAVSAAHLQNYKVSDLDFYGIDVKSVRYSLHEASIWRDLC